MKVFRIISAVFLTMILFSCATEKASDSREVSLSDEISAVSQSYHDPHSGYSSEEDKAEINTDAVNPDKTEPSEKKEEPVLNPELPLHDFKLKVREMMPWNMRAVLDGGEPLLIIHDLDKNGYRDALVVAVEDSGDDETELAALSKTARLFQSDRRYTNFMLLIFYQYSDDVILRYTVPVSQQLVFSGVQPFEIKKGSDFPYALEFTFRSRSGIEKELVILSGYGITHFPVHENLSEITIVEDIDDDGYRDIIVHEQGFEEGTGFETFLTWYKWNRLEFTEYKNTNIVRNLREFFIVSAEFLRAGDYAGFLSYALDPQTLLLLKKQGLSEQEILNKIFYPAVSSVNSEDADGEDTVNFFTDSGFNAVVFPELMETPFSYEKRNDFSHQVSVRFRPPGSESRIYLAEIKMKKNPFEDQQFCFTVDVIH